ncbi:MAG TPA: 4Fe-4S dicluster domain-containing protein, partial [Halobacteria archaeon]|nr:4Fe-4S dicluster domain-containing protein [Halobacteria archaeon]
MSKITINQDLCSRCNSCVEVCPAEIFVSNKEDIPTVLDAVADKFCISCGHCVAICPKNAIDHKNFQEGRVTPIKQELIPSSDQTREMLRSIRSIREFKDRPVDKELIEEIIDVARFAPSSTNLQTTEYIVVQDKKVLNKIVDLTYSYLAKMSKLLHNRLISSL